MNVTHSNPATEEYANTYDHAERLLKTTHRLNGGTEVILTENTYDELGRLKTAMPNNRQDLKLTYSYNIRNWLTDIEGQRFGERLSYNTMSTTGNKTLWNGNITAVIYNNFGTQGFNYDYDGLNRLTEAEHFFIWSELYYGAYTSEYTYDQNGNMTGMFRIEDLTAEDLTMHYQGNRKTHVSYKTDDDYANGYDRDFRTDNCCPPYTNGFTDYSHGNGTTGTFTYNTNGALTFDPAKNYAVTYNIMGMPRTVSVPAVNGTIEYKYSASGEKLAANYNWHSGLSLDPVENTGKNYTGTNSARTVKYIGNKVYENGVLKRILLPNGYISGNIYYFYLRDHLGNNSVVAQSNGTVINAITFILSAS